MNSLLIVGLGGGLGAIARYLVGRLSVSAFGPSFPWGTFAVNVIGGFAMGLLVGWMAFKVTGGENLRLFLGVGVLGGFTTFSSFSIEALQMMERKAYITAFGYISGSVICAIFAVFIGLMIARKLFTV